MIRCERLARPANKVHSVAEGRLIVNRKGTLPISESIAQLQRQLGSVSQHPAGGALMKRLMAL